MAIDWKSAQETCKNICQWLASTISTIVFHLPLVSGLPKCKGIHYVEAGKEFFVNLILSTSPLWLGSLITFSVDERTEKTFHGYLKVLTGSAAGGEMLIYSTAAIAPIFYFALTKERPDRDFPSRLSHIVSGLLIFMICTALFGVQRSGVKIDPNFVMPMSLAIYVFALAIIFLATVYRNWRDGAGDVIGAAENKPKSDEDAFVAAAREHRK
jgi:hypothetical protein